MNTLYILKRLKHRNAMKSIITKTTGLLCLLTMGQFSFGQTNKTYNGNFNSINFKGTASYQYYENNASQRIFDGQFSFTTSNNSISITGGFQNSFKSGQWKFNLINVANTNAIMNTNIIATVTGAFIKGDMNGAWSLNRKKIISFPNNYVSNYYQSQLNALSYLFDGKTIDFNKPVTATEIAFANFKDNHFSENFSYSVNGKSKVTGQFNDNGYFNGIWTSVYYENNILHYQTREYLNGVLLSIKSKDNSTGDIIVIYDEALKVNEFFQNYDSKENVSKVGDNYLKLVEGKSYHSDVSLLEDAIGVWYNNTSLANSSYAYEIEKGSIKMTIYPERMIAINEEKNQEAEEYAKQKEQKAEQEEIEKKELLRAKKIQDNEAEAERQRKIEEFERSDYGQIKKTIRMEYDAWLKKNEFESQQDYETRVKNTYLASLKEISEKTILFQKNMKTNENKNGFRCGLLGTYDIGNEKYLLHTYNDPRPGYRKLHSDTIHLTISKSYAQQFKSQFSILDYEDCKILVVPLDYVLINNYWILSSALFIFNTKVDNSTWSGYGMTPFSNIKLTNGNVVFSNKYLNPPLDNYNLINIKKANSISDDLYVYIWNITEESFFKDNMTQSVNFTIEDLGIVLPIK